ncbi:sugar phosphate isomerase/epimerase family protein [Pseudomonas sp. JL3]|uniref:sugar phosphate isomerase/epimerase family protein n=1 Tax=Pseudomonas sp. JL3 TaxID=2919943 RepID=UPI00285CC616|nr:sugar phosphate isomerase/epimerase family protein [Pseudomonas sp. JL3]MDR8365332.1 sugar phosphate isomerase/epimerase [Pseudomonas sp. JL3]
MRLSISNIAWSVEEDSSIVELLHSYNVNAIDIAPGKYFPEPLSTSDIEIATVRNWWLEQGIEITGMQALLFGTTGLNMFGSPNSQSEMLRHLDAICRIGAGLGAKRLVFGSPKNRDRSGLSDKEALDAAGAFFYSLGDIAARHGVLVCLEPNPPIYNSNFMTTSAEAAEVVKHTNHQAIKMQLDTGAITLNNEDPTIIIKNFAHLIGHIHISEPNLVPLGDGSTDHDSIRLALDSFLPQTLLTIEMLATVNEPHIVSIKRSLDVAVNKYCNKLADLQR